MGYKMPVILKNLEFASLSFELEHDIVCSETDVCECQVMTQIGLGGKVIEKKYPKLVSIMGRGGLSEPLPESVLKLGPVSTRIKEGRLIKLPDRAKVVEIEP